MSQIRTCKTSEDDYIEILEGVERKTLAYGDHTLLTKFRLKEGKILPLHQHPQEQTAHPISGNTQYHPLTA